MFARDRQNAPPRKSAWEKGVGPVVKKVVPVGRGGVKKRLPGNSFCRAHGKSIWVDQCDQNQMPGHKDHDVRKGKSAAEKKELPTKSKLGGGGERILGKQTQPEKRSGRGKVTRSMKFGGRCPE